MKLSRIGTSSLLMRVHAIYIYAIESLRSSRSQTYDISFTGSVVYIYKRARAYQVWVIAVVVG